MAYDSCTCVLCSSGQQVIDTLNRLDRAVLGEVDLTGRVLHFGIHDRVRKLERWRLLAVMALFGGSFAGNVVGRWLA